MMTQLNGGNPYDADYYASHCGSVPYERTEVWLNVFGNVADQIVRGFAPSRVFDAGCALGMLVESLWDRGVEAYGRDISEFAVSAVRPDVRDFCKVGSIADPIDGTFDLVTCIEVVEHMDAEAALQAIRSIAAVTDRVLFSSSPTDFSEPTHINVRPTAYWLQCWAEAGFAPNITHDAGYLAPHAYILERSNDGRTQRDLTAFTDRIRYRVAMSELGARLAELNVAQTEGRLAKTELAHVNTRIAGLIPQLEAVRIELDRTRAEAGGLRSELEECREAGLRYDSILDQRSIELGQVRAHLQESVAEMGGRVEALRKAGSARESETARRHAEDLDKLATEIALERETVQVAERARHEANQSAHAAVETAAAAARAQTEAAAALDSMKVALFRSEAARLRIEFSLAWRATAPVRSALGLVPQSARQKLRVALRVVRAAVRLRLTTYLRVVHDAKLVAASPLFDAEWYRDNNPDVATGRIEPEIHYALRGELDGRPASPHFSGQRYAERHPEAVGQGLLLLHAMRHGQEDAGRSPAQVPPSIDVDRPAEVRHDPAVPTPSKPPAAIAHSPAPVPDVDALLSERFQQLRPLRTYAAPRGGCRLSIVTDSINAGSLYGGVGTALVLAVLTAQRIGASLRLITRTEPPVASNISEVLSAQGVPCATNIELVHSPFDGGGHAVSLTSGDLFLTTSWWTTWATRQSVPRARMAYLLQEDERMFYPLGDDHLRCSETLSDPNLLYIVNSSLLLGHLRTDDLAPDAVSFEPAFPNNIYYMDDGTLDKADKLNFFFYARPHNVRNLYWRGLEAISGAIEQGILTPDEWNFHFVGRGAPPVSLPRGAKMTLVENMPWPDYAALIRRMDLGLSLMYTPHPSYPPLDLAASGAAVVTNRFGPKMSLDRFSENIICADTDLDSLIKGIAQGVQLARLRQCRAQRLQQSGLSRDWRISAAPAIDRLAAWAKQLNG